MAFQIKPRLVDSFPVVGVCAKNEQVDNKFLNNDTRSTAEKIQCLLKFYLIAKQQTLAERQMICRHWSKIYDQACFNCGENPKNPEILLKIQSLSKVIRALKEVVVAIETDGISIYPDLKLHPHESGKNFLKYGLYDIPLSCELLTWRNIKALFLQENPEVIDDFRREIHNAFKLIYLATKTQRHKEPIVDLLLGHLLAIYAFSSPKAGEVVSVPQRIEGKWEYIEYTVQLIPLVPEWLKSPIYAYGMTPNDASLAPALLLFRGTPYPAADGNILCHLADNVPGSSVGQFLYEMGKEKIDGWIRATGKRVRVFGQSLGGSIAYATALDHPGQVELSVYAPAGLLEKKAIFPSANSHKAYYHGSDLIPLLGYHPEGVELIRIVCDAPRDMLGCHLRSGGTQQTLLLKVDNHQENQRALRKGLTRLHQATAAPLYILNGSFLLLTTALKHVHHRLSKVFS